jgi:hypothetical protein
MDRVASGRDFGSLCQDCHSENTRWPWYSRVAPVSWIVARDVRRGRAKLDFTSWAGRYHSTNERMEICDAVSNGSMPMKAYTIMHRRARLSAESAQSQMRSMSCGESAGSRQASFEEDHRPAPYGEFARFSILRVLAPTPVSSGNGDPQLLSELMNTAVGSVHS